MKLQMSILVTFLVLKNVASSANQCVWYDVCGWDQDYGPDGGSEVHFLNCHYTGPANLLQRNRWI